MATALQIQTFEVILPADLQIVTSVGKSKRESHWLDRTASPREEARILFAMVGRSGETGESLRELIAIPPETEEGGLTRYARKYPEDAFGIERVIGFRQRVAEEFERRAVQEETEQRTSLNGTVKSLR